MRSRNMYFAIFFVFVSLIVGSVSSQVPDCDNSLDHITQAQTALGQDDFHTAMRALGCALESDTFNHSLRIEHLSSSLLGGDYMIAYGDAFLLNNIAPEILLTYLDELRKENGQHKLRAFLAIFAVVPDYELALSDVEQILDSEPEEAFSYVIRAAAYEGLEDYGMAEVAFNRAVELASDEAQIFGLMAATQFTIFNVEGVRENSSRAIELNPNIAQLFRLRGFTSMVMGEPQAAIEDANRAIEIDPGYFAFYILRGNGYLAMGDTESAMADFDQIIALVPQSSFGYALRAELQMQMGQEGAAAGDLATAIEFDTLERIDGEALILGTPITVTMSFGRVYYLPFDVLQGDRLTFSASSVEPAAVDPVILLISPNGAPLTFNDDADPFGELLDSVIADFEASTSGIYTLVISHARGGSEGDIRVLVEQE